MESHYWPYGFFPAIYQINGIPCESWFSVSHHSGLVSLVVSNDLSLFIVFVIFSLIGVDITRYDLSLSPQRQSFLLSSLKSHFHPNEQLEMDRVRFYRYWTLKEAYLKAIGVGLGDFRRPLSALDFSRCIDERVDEWVSLGMFKERKLEGWLFYTTLIDDYYVLSIACGKQSDADQSVQEIGGYWENETLVHSPSIEQRRVIQCESFQINFEFFSLPPVKLL